MNLEHYQKNYDLCKKYLNRYVQIKTVNGTYRGKIVKVVKNRVYLQTGVRTKGKNAQIKFFPFIIPLVLFDLLVIALLDRPFIPFGPGPFGPGGIGGPGGVGGPFFNPLI